MDKTYTGYDPLLGGDNANSNIRQCRNKEKHIYDGDNFNKCPYCYADSLGTTPSRLFKAAKFCDKARNIHIED